MKKFLGLCIFFLCASGSINAQLFFKATLKANREKVHRNLIQSTINQNLSTTLTDSTEENWQDAFYAMELLQYKSMWADGRIKAAAEQMHLQSVPFQRAALELLYANYPDTFYRQVKFLMMQTQDPKIFVMCGEYILQCKNSKNDLSFLAVKTEQWRQIYTDNALLAQLQMRILQQKNPLATPSIIPFLKKSYLPGKVLLFSFQRKNRNYPGIVMLRDRNGNFITDSNGMYFSVPQLARSINNLPGYITNGNTPEGIFRMKGYDVSRAVFIGPTVNIQLSMPYERTPKHFYNDSSISDTTWDINYYRNLLPQEWKSYNPIYQSYYAGKAGRTEIIVHGSTVNPMYYIKQPYYPLTPTQGCLTSKEVWDENTGIRTQSDQQLLINSMIKAGGADGYAIVINIDDEQRPVLLYDIVPMIEQAQQK
ncbi:MAG TPA: hypothetical protein PK504_13015 [Ferruginibacter sp.]|nr:hypothetical protein [Ferruginibacter sp.]HRE64108.1 hypothetical protein [Ferruginibacter sp.]